MNGVFISLTLKAKPEQVGQAVLEISNKLEHTGKENPFEWVKPQVFSGWGSITYGRDGIEKMTFPDPYQNLKGVAEIEIGIKSISAIVKGIAGTVHIQAEGETSKLTVYAKRENFVLIQERWVLLYDEILRRGWVKPQVEWSFDLPRAFKVIDAATFQYLETVEDLVASNRKEEIADALTVFRLSHKKLGGRFALLKIRLLGDALTRIEYKIELSSPDLVAFVSPNVKRADMFDDTAQSRWFVSDADRREYERSINLLQGQATRQEQESARRRHEQEARTHERETFARSFLETYRDFMTQNFGMAELKPGQIYIGKTAPSPTFPGQLWVDTSDQNTAPTEPATVAQQTNDATGLSRGEEKMPKERLIFDNLINGTPAQFGVKVETFDRRFVVDGTRYETKGYSLFACGALRSDANPVAVHFFSEDGEQGGSHLTIKMQAYIVPTGATCLRVWLFEWAEYPEDPTAIKAFESLHREMLREGWFEKKVQAQSSDAMPGNLTQDTTPTEPAKVAAQVDTTRKRGMNDDTREKLKRLCEIRNEKIRAGKIEITWTNACQLAKIDPDTARTHAKELRARWDDPEYRAEFAE